MVNPGDLERYPAQSMGNTRIGYLPSTYLRLSCNPIVYSIRYDRPFDSGISAL